MYKFLILFFMLGATAIIYKALERVYLSQTVIARVTLKTNCELDPKAFAVRILILMKLENFSMVKLL